MSVTTQPLEPALLELTLNMCAVVCAHYSYQGQIQDFQMEGLCM